ncbi:MAG: thermonuclease family protein [Pseudomonadota bacterium]
MKRVTLLLILCFSLYGCEKFNFSATHEGKVIKVLDGDTLKLVQHGEEVTIRMAEIDAPEYSQPFWKNSKQALMKRVAGKQVTVEEFDRDQYGRIVGHVYLNDVWINGELVQQGYAYVYERYAVSKKLYKFEAEAEKHQRGVWKLPAAERMKPWIWRKNKNR